MEGGLLLSLNLIWFSFKYLMITVKSLSGASGGRAVLPLLQSQGISQPCFLRQYLTKQRCSSPSRMVSVGLLTAGLPFRVEEEGGPGQPASKTYVLIRVKKSPAECGLQARRQFPALTLVHWGNLRKSQLLAGPCLSHGKWGLSFRISEVFLGPKPNKSQFMAFKEGQNLWVTKYNWLIRTLTIRW